MDDERTRSCIAEVHARTGYVMDPHTAVGWWAMEAATQAGSGPRVVLSTAHPAKFPEVVERATGVGPELPGALATRMDGAERMVHLPARGGALRELLLEEVAR